MRLGNACDAAVPLPPAASLILLPLIASDPTSTRQVGRDQKFACTDDAEDVSTHVIHRGILAHAVHMSGRFPTVCCNATTQTPQEDVSEMKSVWLSLASG